MRGSAVYQWCTDPLRSHTVPRLWMFLLVLLHLRKSVRLRVRPFIWCLNFLGFTQSIHVFPDLPFHLFLLSLCSSQIHPLSPNLSCCSLFFKFPCHLPPLLALEYENKALYTATPVAGGWAGAVMGWAGAVVFLSRGINIHAWNTHVWTFLP